MASREQIDNAKAKAYSDSPNHMIAVSSARVLADALTKAEEDLASCAWYRERIHTLKSERDRLLVWLREIADLDPKTLYAGYDAVRLAQSARKEVGDE
jgi:hypothetical protein